MPQQQQQQAAVFVTTCPKCRLHGTVEAIHLRFCTKDHDAIRDAEKRYRRDKRYRDVYDDALAIVVEHWDRTCGQCGFTWTEPMLEASASNVVSVRSGGTRIFTDLVRLRSGKVGVNLHVNTDVGCLQAVAQDARGDLEAEAALDYAVRLQHVALAAMRMNATPSERPGLAETSVSSNGEE